MLSFDSNFSNPCYEIPEAPPKSTAGTLDVGDTFQLGTNQPTLTVLGKVSVREMIILAVLPKKKGKLSGGRGYRVLHLSTDRFILRYSVISVASDCGPIDLTEQVPEVSAPVPKKQSRGTCPRCRSTLTSWGVCPNFNCDY